MSELTDEYMKEVYANIKFLRTSHRGKNDMEPMLADNLEMLLSCIQSKDETIDWFATRFERLNEWAIADLSGEQREHFFNISANGTKTPLENPTYAQRMNLLRHDLKALQKELADKRYCKSVLITRTEETETKYFINCGGATIFEDDGKHCPDCGGILDIPWKIYCGFEKNE